jgi:aryl-alcohol dehydrogenase-like predicted oxidoreductase
MTELSGRAAAESGVFSIGGDLPVHRLGFGAMRITGPGIWGEPADRDEATRVLRRTVELGLDLIDTADSYGPNVSEELIAEALHPYPDGLIIATKAGLTRQGPNLWAAVGRPEYLHQQLELSLRRLRVERIDLYQFHRVDEKVPLEDSLGKLEDLRAAGKIRHIGVSNVTLDQLQQARRVVNVVTVQNRYNLTDRASQDVLDYCTAEGIGFIPWAPLATGELAGSGSVLDVAAKAHNATPSQLALAWLLHLSPVVLPIPGTSTVAHLEDNVAAAKIKLTAGEVADLTALA